MHLLFKLCLFLNLQTINTKQDYRLLHDYAVADAYNKDYYNSFTIKNVKLNRTIKTFYILYDIKKDVTSMMMLIQPYLFLSNEYKTWMAGQARFDYCKLLDMNLFGTWDHLEKFSNFTKCPHIKNIYYMSNLLPDDTDLPAHLPPGKYKVEFKFTTREKVYLFQFTWYGSIESTKPLRRKH